MNIKHVIQDIKSFGITTSVADKVGEIRKVDPKLADIVEKGNKVNEEAKAYIASRQEKGWKA